MPEADGVVVPGYSKLPTALMSYLPVGLSGQTCMAGMIGSTLAGHRDGQSWPCPASNNRYAVHRL